jgi:antitoxin (DNA-binding transcriptional repressor) of toxin-antitoxin stability system
MTENRIRAIGIESARAELGDLVDNARMRGESTILTRHGKAAATIIPVHVPYSTGDEIIDAEAIRAITQDELRSIEHVKALHTQPYSTGFGSLVSEYAVGAGRLFEIAPWRALADEIGPGFDTDAEPLGGGDAEHIVACARAVVARMRIQLDQATWPTPSTDASDAALLLAEIAGLQRFVAILSGYYRDGQ